MKIPSSPKDLQFPSAKDFEPYYPAIGRAIIAWAFLEIKIDELLLNMLRHEKASTIRELAKITRVDDIPKSLGSRLKLCDDLAKLYYKPDVVQKLKSITQACRGQYKTRNRLAHGEWLIRFSLLGRPPPRIMCRMRRFGIEGPERRFTVALIENLTRIYHGLAQQIVEFSRSHDPAGPIEERLKRFLRIQIGKNKT
jgi:hypothetical protein